MLRSENNWIRFCHYSTAKFPQIGYFGLVGPDNIKNIRFDQFFGCRPIQRVFNQKTLDQSNHWTRHFPSNEQVPVGLGFENPFAEVGIIGSFEGEPAPEQEKRENAETPHVVSEAVNLVA